MSDSLYTLHKSQSNSPDTEPRELVWEGDSRKKFLDAILHHRRKHPLGTYLHATFGPKEGNVIRTFQGFAKA